MPEIMSAKELVMEIIEKYYTSSFSPERTKANCALVVSSRDSAMLEKYKEAIRIAEAKSKKMQLCANDAIAALNSVFAGVEGGK